MLIRRQTDGQTDRQTDRHHWRWIELHEMNSYHDESLLLLLPLDLTTDSRMTNCSVFWLHRSTTYVDAVHCYRRSSVVCLSVCRDRETYKNSWTDRYAVWDMDSGGRKKHCRSITWGSDTPLEGAILMGDWGIPLYSIGILCRQLCKNGWTDRNAVWDAESGSSRKPCIRWGVHWRHPANATEPSMCGGDAALCQITLTTYYYLL